MKSFEYTIKNPIGIHARPAGMLAKTAKGYESVITVVKGEKSCDCTHLMKLMAMCVKCGDTVTVTIEGTDENTAAEEMKAYFENNL